MKKLKRILIGILLFFLVLFSIFLGYLFVGKASIAEKITWGVNFSQKHTEQLYLDWKKTYLAILDDLNVKRLKLAVHWDMIEHKDGYFYFNDLDWQVDEAAKRGAKIILVIGIKTGRWPECHIPGWALDLSKEEQQEKILRMLQTIVSQYEGDQTILAWQVENEPLFPFGICPWTDSIFAKKEVELVKSIDPLNRPVIMSDSGEASFWIQSALIGDIVGTTIYKKVWFKQIGMYINYPIPPVFYWRKAQIIKTLFNKKVICVELQAEPFGPKLLYESPLEEQKKSMDLNRFRENIDFATKTGLDTFYLWGTEWMYWMKEKQNQPEIWNEAKKLF